MSIENVIVFHSSSAESVITDEFAVDFLAGHPLAARSVHAHVAVLGNVEVGWRKTAVLFQGIQPQSVANHTRNLRNGTFNEQLKVHGNFQFANLFCWGCRHCS